MDAIVGKKHTITDNDYIVNINAKEYGDQNSDANNVSIRRNPSILLALDSVHRSLLLKNLQFDQEIGNHNNNNKNSSSNYNDGGSGTCDVDSKQRKHENEPEDPLEVLAKSLALVEVNEPLTTAQQKRKQLVQNEHTDELDFGFLELVKLRRDRNNNSTESRVMMMVAKYELGKGGGKRIPIDETETSDFDTASVSSVSSLGSARSSSAFSEVSRDVVSVENLGRNEPEVVVGTGESHKVTAGGATITINIINKTTEQHCDTRPLKTGPEMKAVHVQVPECTSEDEEEQSQAPSPRIEEASTECEEEEEEEEGSDHDFMKDSRITEIYSDQSLLDKFITAESEDYLDCNNYSKSPASCYDNCSEDEDAKYNHETKRDRKSPEVFRREFVDDEDEPMINIIQEMTQDMQVTSTVILNKAKIKQHRKVRETEKKQKHKSEQKLKQKLENSHISRQKIIDDNFCNEILDSTIHFDKLYGINRRTAAPAPTEVLSDSALQPSSADADESFDSTVSFGKLEGTPRYSGRPVGKLMAKRLKKLDRHDQCKSEGFSDSSTSNYTNGPKKPPRTFATSRKSSKAKVGWVGDVQPSSDKSSGKSATEKPSCPKLEDLDSDQDLIGWKFEEKKRSHDIGWVAPKEKINDSAIPPHIYSMLHYSDDETRKRLIKTSHSRAAPQSTACCHRKENPLGPKLDIDTVDYAPETPRRKSSSNSDFERFVANSKIKSTPYKKLPQAGKRTELFLDSERGERNRRSPDRRRSTMVDFLENERTTESKHFLDDGRRSDHEPDPEESMLCKKCNDKASKKSFRKAAVRRTKSFFEASKKKINLQNYKEKEQRYQQTPKKKEMDSNLDSENSTKKQLHKHLGYTPDRLRCGSCPKKSDMVRNNLTQAKSAPARCEHGYRPDLPARTVLNFSGTDMASEDDTSKIKNKQKLNDSKFLKTLKNLKISPKKLFKANENSKQSPLAPSPREHGDFQSYDDLNLDNVARMGDFLNNVRQVVETELNNSRERILDDACLNRYRKFTANSPQRNRHVSTSSEYLDRPDLQRRIQVAADLHHEPIYQEISPKNNKTIVNEFISGESCGRRYMMVDNDPNLLYAVVNKTSKPLIKNKSHNEKQLNAEPSSPQTPSDTSNKPRRSLFTKDTSSEAAAGDPRNSNPVDEDNDISVLQDVEEAPALEEHRDGAVHEEVVLRKRMGNVGSGLKKGETALRNSVGYGAFSSNIQRSNSGTMERGVYTCEEQLLESAVAAEMVGRAPLGCIDTDDEVDSLAKYDDNGLDDLFTSLRERISISEIDTIDTESEAFITGYDTVDFRPLTPPRRNKTGVGTNGKNGTDKQDRTVDVSELMRTALDYSLSSASPVNSTPLSGRMRMNGSDIYRSFRDKLRTSFRKSKHYFKNEHRKNAKQFDEKPKNTWETSSRGVAFDPDEYRRKYDDETTSEEIYQSLNNSGALQEQGNKHLVELVKQIESQIDIKKQLKQALSICRNTREFECSSELIEAERLLLLSTLKETAARNELRSVIDSNTNPATTQNDDRQIGLVALNHLEFPLKETAVTDMLFNYFYVVVCSYKNQVKSTMSKERFGDRVSFRNCEIKFKNLDADYKIRVEVFVLRLRKNRGYGSEGKQPSSKNNKINHSSVSTSSMFRNPVKLLTNSRPNSPQSTDFTHQFSRFKSQGFITLSASSLCPSNGVSHQPPSSAETQQENRRHHSPVLSASSNFQQMVRRQGDRNVYLVEDFKYFKLDSVVYYSNLVGGIGMSIKSEVVFVNSDISGFLTVGQCQNSTIDWSRKWCKANGFVLEFWNYPQECQEKLPTLQIDLTKCNSDEVDLADRATCSRPRTFRIDVFPKGTGSCSSSGISSYKDSDSHQHNQNNGGSSNQQPQSCDNTKMYLLSVDTPNELQMWLNELNRVVKFLKEWRI
ncbi:uncharacterized protein LOC129767596 [Toxorhynchites rutilus septentrionalis]|uniref:uncharacterized protein LOC129767596 n=1 Tax=Toxorhynchites rutilus septentrionalis TaxID=329112 RepID=UPI002478AEC2|nr:uncharacterized protein LOC129767596 [Toxorhynchites rutilus septentrionalis]